MYQTVQDVAAANPAITVKQVTHSYNQPSVIAAIPGNSTEVVVVSAHYDSIGSPANGRAPGADDNASVRLMADNASTPLIVLRNRVLLSYSKRYGSLRTPSTRAETHWSSTSILVSRSPASRLDFLLMVTQARRVVALDRVMSCSPTRAPASKCLRS